MNLPDMRDWMPIRVDVEAGRPMVDWCHMGEVRCTEPFFTETVERRLRDPFALLFRRQTPIDELLALEERSPGVPPQGFVFHMSRCGSTLISQMFAQLPENVVLSEPTPLELLLRLALLSPGIPDAQWIAWLRALLAAMAQPRTGVERRVIVKFDAWPVLALPLLRRAFPGVPWIFVHRDPLEVLVSHQRQTGATMVPGPLPPMLFGVAPSELARFSLEEYQARVLASLCDAAAMHLHDGGMAVAYTELPEAAWTSIAAHFGLSLSEPDVEAMRRAARVDVKRPGREFRDDTAAKRASAPAEMRHAAQRFAMPSWHRLEAARDRGAGAVLVGTG